MKRMNRRMTWAVAGLAAAGLTLAAEAEHSDIEVFNDNGSLVVEGGSLFEGEFGDAGTPFATINPGFASEPDEAAADGFSTLPDGEQISFNILKGLFFWDGSQVAPVPADHFLRVQQGSLSSVIRDVDGTTGFQNGFIFGEEGDATGGSLEEPEPGGFHAHLTFELLKNGSSVPEAGTDAGAYGLVMELDGSTLDESNPFGVLLNFGLEESDFEAAESDFAAFIPEPASLALVGLGGLMILARRRRDEGRQRA